MMIVKVDGVDYSPDGIEGVRAKLIELRDGALKQNSFEWAVILSHVIAQLAYLDELRNLVPIYYGRTWQFEDAMDMPHSFLPHVSVQVSAGAKIKVLLDEGQD